MKNKNRKLKKFEEFFVCPNCRAPLYRKSALKKGYMPTIEYCGQCGVKIAEAIAEASADKRGKENSDINIHIEIGESNCKHDVEEITRQIQQRVQEYLSMEQSLKGKV